MNCSFLIDCGQLSHVSAAALCNNKAISLAELNYTTFIDFSKATLEANIFRKQFSLTLAIL